MKKILIYLLSIGIFGVASIANSQTIRIGTEGAYPPWNNLNSAGDLEGAEIDFGNEACKRMGVTCEWVTQDWDGIIPALLQGKYDIIIAGMSITEERKEKVNFTTGYMTDGARFAVLKNSGLANLNIAGMAKVNLNNAGGKEQAAIGQLIAAISWPIAACSFPPALFRFTLAIPAIFRSAKPLSFKTANLAPSVI